MHSPIDSENYVKPILGRTKIDIWECYARHVLQFIDSNKYGNLAYSDKPDLIDRAQSLGIEVTASQSQDSRKAESLYSKLLYENDSSQEKRRIELIEQCGAHFEKGVLFGPNGTDSFEPIIEALRKKLDRLDSGDYELFRRNELFVRSNILADEEMLREALSNMKKESRDHSWHFVSVIVSVPGYNYIFDLDASTCVSLEFGYADQYRIALEANKEVNIAESSRAELL
ncbi:hypothetical protein I0600191H4_08830 [Collinsella sp. i06-0019-1H4]